MDKNIRFINKKEAQQLLDGDSDGNYRPLGKFIFVDIVNDEPVFVAIDNSTGEAFTEEFRTRYSATLYLHGRPCTNIYDEKLNS